MTYNMWSILWYFNHFNHFLPQRVNQSISTSNLMFEVLKYPEWNEGDFQISKNERGKLRGK